MYWFPIAYNITPNLTSLKQTHLLAHSSVGQKFGMDCVSGISEYHKAEIKMSGWAKFSPGGSGGKSASRFIQIVCQIQFLAVIGLRFLFLCWLSPGNCSQYPEAAYNPCLLAPSTFMPEMASWILVSLTSRFKGFMGLGQAHLDDSPFLKVSCAWARHGAICL